MSKKNIATYQPSIDALYDKIAAIIEEARAKVASTVNLTMVYTYYEIGRYIVEDEQHGNVRAEYGKSVLKNLAKRLAAKYGRGFSADTLERTKKFYLLYSQNEISATPLRNLDGQDSTETISATLLRKSSETKVHQPFTLSWSHYIILMGVKNEPERRFYEIEATQNRWSVRELNRQYSSSLYERLALSRDKDKVLELSRKGQVIAKSEDVLKNPITLEFLGLDEKSTYSETTLESRIISKLQPFLLEMGKGFLFEARQKRFTFDERHFFVDLVLYNRLLQCYVLIDLKTGDLKHQDLGQMQMYVNYYDRYVKKDFEKPTIGILLCKRQSKTIVELTLPKEANIYSSEYSLYLPDKKLLQSKLNEWIEEFEENED